MTSFSDVTSRTVGPAGPSQLSGPGRTVVRVLAAAAKTTSVPCQALKIGRREALRGLSTRYQRSTRGRDKTRITSQPRRMGGRCCRLL